MRILVTGADGFVGSRLCDKLKSEGHSLKRVMRKPLSAGDFLVSNIDKDTDYTQALKDVDCIVHLAARVHVMKNKQHGEMAEYRKVNVEGTLNLARQAIKAGVRRFIYLSSIKVNGESTKPDRPFTADDEPNPQDFYAISKLEAERGLFELANQSNMEVVCIRPPLVYGPSVKANFRSMMNWLYKGIPLPFGSVHNKRAIVALDNLVDLIFLCTYHPAAANQIFLVGDGEDLSTTDLLRITANALGLSVRLFPIPKWFLTICFAVLGKRGMSHRLLGNLQADITKTKKLLGWKPVVTVEEAIQATAKRFLQDMVK